MLLQVTRKMPCSTKAEGMGGTHEVLPVVSQERQVLRIPEIGSWKMADNLSVKRNAMGAIVHCWCAAAAAEDVEEICHLRPIIVNDGLLRLQALLGDSMDLQQLFPAQFQKFLPPFLPGLAWSKHCWKDWNIGMYQTKSMELTTHAPSLRLTFRQLYAVGLTG